MLKNSLFIKEKKGQSIKERKTILNFIKTIRSLKRINKLKKMLSLCLLVLLFTLKTGIINACALTQDEIHILTSVMFAEQDNPKATQSLLNVYYNINPNLLKSIKSSSAYRLKSKRYLLAYTHNLKGLDLTNYNLIKNKVESFIPDTKFKYVKHESLSFYKDYNTMINTLKVKWANSNINFNDVKLIEGQYYFKRLID